MLSKCCCCVPLRTGSIILAILGILGGIFAFAISRGQWSSIVEGIFYLLSYGFLLFGAIKYNEKAVLVCLVLSAASIILGVVFCIIAIANIEMIAPKLANDCAAMIDELNKLGMTCDQFKSTTIGIVAGTFIGSSLVSAYFWICNYSFYKQLKEGGASCDWKFQAFNFYFNDDYFLNNEF